MAVRAGNSFFSIRRGDRTRSDYSLYTPPMELLDANVAPVGKQLRVFVNETEYEYYDGTAITTPTNRWVSAPASAVTGGIACWGVRFIFDPIGTADCRINQVAVWDENGELMTPPADWSVEDEMSDWGGDTLDTDAFEANVLDLAYNTNQEFSGSGVQRVTFRFPTKLAVSKFGWSSWYIGGSAEMVQNMEIQVNTGTPSDPEWTSIGSNLTQAVGNSADNHTAGTALTSDDYPTCSVPIVPATELLTLSVLAADMGGTIPPTLTITPVPDTNTDTVLILRETRQDQPWVRPTNTAYAHPEKIMTFFDQIRLMVRDIADLKTVGPFFGLGIAEFNENDYSAGLQMQAHTLSTESGPFSYSEIELLDTLPGAQLDDRHQLVVEAKVTSASAWQTLTYSATPVTEDQYSVNSAAKTITLGDTRSDDLRIRRVTRSDQWWYDPRGGAPGWNRLAINAMQRQARYLLEEADGLPSWYADSPLARSIFPRGWNWFTYVGTRDQWTIPGAAWGGDGVVRIYKNDVLLVEGTDYRLTWPHITWIGGDPESTDTVHVGVTSGGFAATGLGGGDDSEDLPEDFAGGTETPAPKIDFPSWGVPTNLGFSIDLSSVSKATLIAGDWEGENSVDFSQGNAPSAEFLDHVLRVELAITLSNIMPDGGGGYYPIGAREVWYIVCKCDGTAYRVAVAWKNSPEDAWSANRASGAFGCLFPRGASGGLDIWSALDPPVSSSSDPSMRLYDRLIDSAVREGDVPLAEQVPCFSSWAKLTQMSADSYAAGQGTASGFSNDQWESYLDPDEDFTDFDIPDP